MHLSRLLLFAALLPISTGASHGGLVGRYRMDTASAVQAESSGATPQADAFQSSPTATNYHLYQQPGVPAGTYGSITLPAGAIPYSAGFASSAPISSTDHWLVTTATPPTVTAPTRYNLLVNNFTVMAWINPATVLNTKRVFSTQVNGVTNHSWGFGITTNKLRFTDYGNYDSDTPATPILPNTWQHIAAVKSTAGVQFYHNGILVHTDAARTGNITASPTSATNWRILNGPNSEIFLGNVAEVRVYDTALTQSEIITAAGHLPTPTGVLKSDFSNVTNPYLNFSHGAKPSVAAGGITLFTSSLSSSSTKPAARLADTTDDLWIGKAPANAASVAFPAAGGSLTDWLAGTIYHAWSGGRTGFLTSRLTVPANGYYDVAASWKSHAQSGCKAQAYVVVNGVTVFSGLIDGFAGTSISTAAPSGPSPTAAFAFPGYNLTAGDVLEFVTVPDVTTPAGNLAVEFSAVAVAGPPVASGNLLISEFVAVNNNSLADEDGDHPDWIEIYNGTGTSVDLTNWSLTDSVSQPRKWNFPPRNLAHGQFLIVFASNKDSAKRPFYNAASQLHTNFQLSAAGEYLALVNPAGIAVDSYAPTFPSQISDIAYGHAGSVDSSIGYLIPTPGKLNGSIASSPPGAISFSVSSGVFTTGATQSVALTVTPASGSQVVRYTVNNSEPTLANGMTYAGTPIPVATTAIIRARAFVDGIGGPIAEARYLFVDSTAQPDAISSYRLPIVVIHDLGGGALGDFSSSTEDPQKAALVAVFEPNAISGQTSMAAAPTILSRGGSHVRGSSSSTYKKQGLDLEFWDELGGDRSVTLLGLPANGDWALYAPYQFDRTYINNRLAYELAARMGRYAPRTRFVELYVNTTGNSVTAADYYGIYVLAESVERDKERVDIAGLNPSENSGEAVTGGYIVSINKSNESETVIGSTLTYMRHMRQNIANITLTGGMTTFLDYPEITSVTPAQKSYIENYLKLVEDSIYGANFTHPATGLGYTAYIARDSWIDFHIAQTIPQNIDALRLSTFFSKDRNGKLKAGPVWDYDRSTGSRDSRNNYPGNWDVPYTVNLDKTEYFHYGWWHRLFQDPDFMQLWIDRYVALRQGGRPLDLAGQIFPLIDSYIAEIAPGGSVQNATTRDYARWIFGAAGSGTGLGDARQPLSTEVANQKAWLQSRFNFIDGQILPLPIATVTPAVGGGQNITVTLSGGSGSAQIYATTDGSDPRLPGGNVSPVATIVPNGGTIHIASTTLLRFRHRDVSAPAFNSDATNTKMSTWSGLGESYVVEGATRADAGDITVAALHYHPDDPSPAELAAGFIDADQFEYIELMNISNHRVNLQGCRFTSGFDFTFGTSPLSELSTGERVIVAKNLAAFTARYGTTAASRVAGEFGGNDNLNNAGETITLLASNGVTTLFSFTYSQTVPWPSEADGLGPALVLRAPETQPALGDALNWRASTASGGTPGGTDRVSYTAWKTANGITDDTDDADHDGLLPLAEYALGSSPSIPSLGALPVFARQPDGSYLASLTRTLTADDAACELQTSGDLGGWIPATATLTSRISSATTETLTYSVPGNSDTRRFLRFRFSSQ